MAAKKLGMQRGNNEEGFIRPKSSNGLPMSLSRKKMENDIDFSQLPKNVLDTISQKLNFDDLFDFASVCREWRVVKMIYWKKFLESQSPLLVETTSYAKKFYSFYSIPDQRAYLSEMSYFWGLYYCGSSSGYIIMAGANNTLQLMNPFTRKQKIIDISTIRNYLNYCACRVLLAFAKGSSEFVIVASCKSSFSLHVYQSRNSSWVTYIERANPLKVVDFVVLHNIIYVITDKAQVGVLSLNSSSLKFLKLKNTPNITYSFLNLLSCDGKLLVVVFTPGRLLDVYMIDFRTMSYAKLENLVYSGSNNELLKCIVPAGRRRPHRRSSRSRTYWLDWCFRNLHYEVDYSLVE
ncbi:uncharacterized protein LOC127127200 isoform X4 [Lathyrus oleraceus]|uniref:uncharacterized protein LOC127127200 isoform X3 n=1 Tax=Pisum sativum TaxID=3888 RepID=UPI0021CEBAD8|nr:uncharacterized protein LOC127127200 isoform X3 [Pisum sativum]XP_050912285.1 uncharacterized protein LOC127127200 isoform X4 [Pisum sativum]